jgi:hypothetical protein
VIDLRREENKASALMSALRGASGVSVLPLDVFRSLPGQPIAYTLLSPAAKLLASGETLDGCDVDVNVGMMTGDDFRYIRTWWECPVNGSAEWRDYEKGNGFARFLSDPMVRVRATNDFSEASAEIASKYGSASRFIMNRARYGQPGLVYTRITVKGFSVRFLLPHQVFSGAGLAIFPKDLRSVSPLCAYLNSRAVEHSLAALTDGRKWEAGYVRNAPVPQEVLGDTELGSLSRAGAEQTLLRLSLDETTRFFCGLSAPAVAESRCLGVSVALRDVLTRIDEFSMCRLGLTEQEKLSIDAEVDSMPGWLAREESQLTEDEWEARQMSYFLGRVFGRWRDDVESIVPPSLSDLIERGLPSLPPAAGNGPGFHRSILVDDQGNADDIAVLMAALGADGGSSTGEDECRSWLRRQAFDEHLGLYSACRRRAPIYWRLGLATNRYSVWIYFHALSRDTLFRIQNDYVAPKLAHEERRLESMRSEFGNRASALHRRELAAQEAVIEDLRAFLEDVKRVAPLWSPNLEDGVIVNFAPLWRLVSHHKPWQKELKVTWDALCDGKYDWSHLAMHLWPERVIPKCARDRSLAIAHDLEDVFWVEETDGKWTARKEPTRSVDELVRARISPAVKAALKSLLDASIGSGRGSPARGGRRQSAATLEGGSA